LIEVGETEPKTYAEAQAMVESLRIKINQLEAERNEKTIALYNQIEDIAEPYRTAENVARIQRDAISKLSDALFRTESAAKWVGKLPELVFEEEPHHKKDIINWRSDFFNWYNYSDATKQMREKIKMSLPNAVAKYKTLPNGLVILGLKELTYNDIKVYFCFGKNKLVSWLYVKPSQHPGDDSDSKSDIEGFGWRAQKPYTRWVAMMEEKKVE